MTFTLYLIPVILYAEMISHEFIVTHTMLVSLVRQFGKWRMRWISSHRDQMLLKKGERLIIHMGAFFSGRGRPFSKKKTHYSHIFIHSN